jgi:hypothetical protein
MLRKDYRYTVSVLITLLYGTAGLYAVKVGDTESQVIAELGKPSGTSPLGPGKMLLTYERGTVIVSQGKVTSANLSSLEDYKQAKKSEADEKLRLQKKQEADARALALKEADTKANEQRLQEEAKRNLEASEAAERRRSRPELSPSTTFDTTGAAETNEIYVKSLKLSVVRGPTPPPYESSKLGNDGGGHWRRYKTIVHPAPPCPHEIKILLTVSNNTTLPLTGLNLVYKLNVTDDTAITTTQNRDVIILPKSSGEIEITVRVNDQAEWDKLQDLESVTVQFFKGETAIAVGNCNWTRKDAK